MKRPERFTYEAGRLGEMETIRIKIEDCTRKDYIFRKLIIQEFANKKTKRKEFCSKTGITEAILSNFINGNTNFNLANTEKAMAYFDIKFAKVTDNNTIIKLY